MSSRQWPQTSREYALNVSNGKKHVTRSGTQRRSSPPVLSCYCDAHVAHASAPVLLTCRVLGCAELAMNISASSLSSPSRGRLFYGRYRSQRAEESRRRRLQLAAIGVACVVAALLTFSLCVLSAPAFCARARALTLASLPTQHCASVRQPTAQLVFSARAYGVRARRRHLGWARKHNAGIPRGACASGCEMRGGGRIADTRRYTGCAAPAAAADDFGRRV